MAFCPKCGHFYEQAPQFCQQYGSPISTVIAEPTPRSIIDPSFRSRIPSLVHKGLYVLSGLLALVSIFTPWWTLHASSGTVTTSLGTRSLASFDLNISPTGLTIAIQLVGQNFQVADPTGLLSVVSAVVSIALLPVSAGLVFAFINGLYCPARKRVGLRLLVAPLWILISLFWWSFYFLSVDRAFGGGLQPSGSTNVALGNYRLATLTWGFGPGFLLAIISTVFFATSFALSTWSIKPSLSPIAKSVSFHSISLLLLCIVNLLGGLGILIVETNSGNIDLGFYALLPSVLLFLMAVFARREGSLLGSDAAEGHAPVPPPSQAFKVSGYPFSQSGKMFCRNCGKEIAANAEVCTFCGAPTSSLANTTTQSPAAPGMMSMKFCMNCGAQIAAQAEICPKCGVRQMQPIQQYQAMRPPEHKSEGLAAVLSFLFTGLGQIYNGQIAKGLMFIVLGIVLAFTILFLIGIILYPIFWIYNIYDAYNTAKNINAGVIKV